MWPETGNSGGWRSPQASAGTPKNTREPARSGKKKPQPRTVGVLLLVACSLLPNYSLLGPEGNRASFCGALPIEQPQADADA